MPYFGNTWPALANYYPPAAPGYTRIQPNYCEADNYISVVTPNVYCNNNIYNIQIGTQFLLPNYPPASNSKYLAIYADCRITSQGSVFVHEFNCESMFDHAGTLIHADLAFAHYEPSGLASGLWLGGGQQIIICPITGPNLEITFKCYDGSPTNALSYIQGVHIAGYFD